MCRLSSEAVDLLDSVLFLLLALYFHVLVSIIQKRLALALELFCACVSAFARLLCLLLVRQDHNCEVY